MPCDDFSLRDYSLWSANGRRNRFSATMAQKTLSAAFGEVLKERRQKAGVSQEALAHAAKVHRTYVGLVERGLRNATLDKGDAMARAIGTSLSALVREAERRAKSGQRHGAKG